MTGFEKRTFVRSARKLTPLGAVFALPAIVACGRVKGGSPVFNDPAPSGIVIATGSVGSLGSTAISGSVEVYSVTGTANVAVRLVGYSAPSGSLYFMALQSGGTDSYVVQLKGSSGNQTYYSSVPSGPNWSAVMFRTTYGNTGTSDVGRANLTMVP